MTYRGRAVKSGNSRGITFESALFRSHPEFADGRFSADYIGPGTLLVRRNAEEGESATAEEDPVLLAYLAFIERDMLEHPERIKPLDPDLLRRAEALIGDARVDLDEDLGDEVYLP